MAAPYILAKTMQDAHAFAREKLGLGKGHYRVVTSPSSISGRRGTKLYLVPGHEKRADRFAMAGALKYTRLEKINGSALQAEAPDNAYPNDERTHEIALRYNRLREPLDGLTPAGVQLSIMEGANTALLADFEAFLDASSTSASELVELVTDGEHETEESLRNAAIDEIAEAIDEPVKQTRRRRCKECGALVEPDDLEQHMADHLPTEE